MFARAGHRIWPGYRYLFLHKKHGLARHDVVMAKPLPG